MASPTSDSSALPSTQELRNLGFYSPTSALTMIAELPGGWESWRDAFATCANPDNALIALARIGDQASDLGKKMVEGPGERRAQVCAILGASRWWADYIITHPDCLNLLDVAEVDIRSYMLRSVGANADVGVEVGSNTGSHAGVSIATPTATVDDMRRAYREILARIVARDTFCATPSSIIDEVTADLSALADGALLAGLALARRDIDPKGTVDFTIISMGKTGAREVNYISDVDVVYVARPAADSSLSDAEAVEIATRLATATAQACSGAGSEAPLWPVDANLRPEGRNGALVRTLESYRSYWEKWAQTWEFQALLKARVSAGSLELGEAFLQAASIFVWNAVSRPGFVEDARAMRTRVENHIPSKDATRELKLGRGGLRDVEFSVQLLQLVHGRTDESLRVRSTLEAIEALSVGGYIARVHAQKLRDCYAFLRAVEHRAQLIRMRRTHLIPTGEDELRTIARGMGYSSTEDLLATLGDIRKNVRSLHEDIYYRPIVAAIAGMSADDATLDRAAARDRLAAIGYINPEGATSHINALTSGTSRRAAIQRQLLPLFISWLAQGADPDQGLLQFRALSEEIGDSHWYLALLRDSGVAAMRLCSILPNSRWIADALRALPEAVKMLDADANLAPRSVEQLTVEATAIRSRYEDSTQALKRIRAMRGREVTRVALADALGDIKATRPALSYALDATIDAALTLAIQDEVTVSVPRTSSVDTGEEPSVEGITSAHGEPPADLALIAMGRYGGQETSYASDADLIAVHQARGGVSDEEAARFAINVIGRLRKLLTFADQTPTIAIDLDLRPEGRNGAMSRSVESYAEYYAKWASTWERQALLRARHCAGSPQVAQGFFAVVDPIRYGDTPTPTQLQEIRLLKARIERERLPRGADPKRHVKLGPGGLADCEWMIQLLQLRHAHTCLQLRVTGTLAAADALKDASILPADDHAIITEAWTLASRIRAGNVLASGRTSGDKLDSLPTQPGELKALAALMGYPLGQHVQLEEDWLRASRRARELMDTYFWNDK